MSLDDDQGIGGTLDSSGSNEENIRCTTLDGIERILIATKIYSEEGCFSDYNGAVEVTTSNPRQDPIVARMVSRRRLNWCVIAMIDNSNPSEPRVFAINQVVADDPDVNDPRWMRSVEA